MNLERTLNVIILPKYENSLLTSGLTHSEFRCKCQHESCRATLIHEELVNSYRVFRILVATPLHITSGYRCPLHNHEVGGVPDSWHTGGGAIDVGSRNPLKKLSSDEVLHLALEAGFKYVQYYPVEAFFHLDIRS